MNVMTIGFKKASYKPDLAWFVLAVSRYFASECKESGTKADMFVGRPGAEKADLEDDGRTMILPINQEFPEVYACVNETGGLTFMLAEEY